MSAISAAVGAVANGVVGGYLNRKAGSAQKKASANAAKAQLEATDKQINYLKQADRIAARRLQPFVNVGKANLQPLQDLATQQGQQNYLQNNPMFGAALDYTGRRIEDAAAAGGKLRSGGTLDSLMRNYMAQGDAFVGNQFNRLLAPVNIGQASAAGQASNTMNTGVNVANAFGNQGDITAAAMINRGNIANENRQQQLNMLGGSVLGALGADKVKGMQAGGGWQGALLGGFLGGMR